ncbi:MAG: Phosphate acyltransferase [Firmicutes bacterium ADurb.Bin456]|nr:MAG: Phosphate acyltransferase [Firmicutes bacterium ADurb.Bin456]
MKIAVDAMGGDFAPGEIVKGALQAAREFNQAIILVGDEAQIRTEMGDVPSGELISIVHAPEVIQMNEQPAVNVRRKKNSSIVTATRLVKEGEAGALVSAGSTGAAMAAALLGLGRIKGIDRPAIAGILPNLKGFTVLLDIGANTDCKPHNLLQFGIMGYLYARNILGIEEPRVGLLSNGEEKTKGNETTLAAFPVLADAGINFVGNVEGRDIFNGSVDVVVCDGFVGNIVLKAGEGLAMALYKMMKEEITRSWLAKIGILMAEPALRMFQRRVDYAEYGGAPLLGVDGISIICHGSSSARALKNGIKVARQSVEKGLVKSIQESVAGNLQRKGAGANLARTID